MTRTVAKVGIAALAVAAAAVVTQAQGPGQNATPRQSPQIGQRGPLGPGQGRGLGQAQRPGLQRGVMGQGRVGRPGQALRGGAPGRRGGGPLRGLGLSEEQHAQAQAIREQARKDVEALLTPEQLEQLKTRGRRGGRGDGPAGGPGGGVD